MSCVYKGLVIETDLSRNSKGGTEQMRDRLLRYVDPDLLAKVAIHISRPKKLYANIPNILWCSDLPEDPAIQDLLNTSEQYDYFVFVSYWQRDQFINYFGLPYSKCIVIQNAIETDRDKLQAKQTDKIKFIYHTTPHRGLELVYPIFDALCKTHLNIHLDVFSSFGIYGWEQRDLPYQALFEKIQKHPCMTYHGAKSNSDVLESLKEAHIFLYPSIWKETSCIALIEAMNSGCICVYPSYGALPETGSFMANVGMYDYSENLNENASRAYELCDWILTAQKQQPDFLSMLSSTSISKAPSEYSIHAFKRNWEFLLKKVIESKKQ